MAWAALSENPMSLLCVPHLVGEWAAAGHDDQRQAGTRERGDPLVQNGLGGRAAAELDDGALHEVTAFLADAGATCLRFRARPTRSRRLLLRPLALDLHADAARPELELLHPHRDAHDARIFQHKRGDLLGQRLAQLDMAPRDDGADAVHDDVVGEYMAHVFGAGR